MTNDLTRGLAYLLITVATKRKINLDLPEWHSKWYGYVPNESTGTWIPSPFAHPDAERGWRLFGRRHCLSELAEGKPKSGGLRPESLNFESHRYERHLLYGVVLLKTE